MNSQQTIKIQLWDLSGQKRFNTLINTFFRESDAIILCYAKFEQSIY